MMTMQQGSGFGFGAASTPATPAFGASNPVFGAASTPGTTACLTLPTHFDARQALYIVKENPVNTPPFCRTIWRLIFSFQLCERIRCTTEPASHRSIPLWWLQRAIFWRICFWSGKQLSIVFWGLKCTSSWSSWCQHIYFWFWWRKHACIRHSWQHFIWQLWSSVHPNRKQQYVWGAAHPAAADTDGSWDIYIRCANSKNSTFTHLIESACLAAEADQQSNRQTVLIVVGMLAMHRS